MKQVEMGILELVADDKGPTPWVYNLVILPNDQVVDKSADGQILIGSELMEIRITVDNEAKTRRYQVPRQQYCRLR